MRTAAGAVFIAILSLAGKAAETESEVLILDAGSAWRSHATLKEPVVEADGSVRPIVFVDPQSRSNAQGVRSTWRTLLSKPTAPPPADWARPDFDDVEWLRGPVARACRTPYLARLCLRAPFGVSDPARVRALRLSVGYCGGLVVRVNGEEVGRRHVVKGTSEIADPYPKECFVSGDGKLIRARGTQLLAELPEETVRRVGLRTRTLEIEVPARLLRKGTNVLALEVIRAPYHKVVDEQKGTLRHHDTSQQHDLSWIPCEVRQVKLAAASADGLAAHVARPAGLCVWNSDVLAADYDVEFGNSAEPLRPIRLAGVRNGSFSGKVVVGTSRPIGSLKATASDLKGPGAAVIPTSQVRIRYGLPWGFVPQVAVDSYDIAPYPGEAMPLTAISDVLPKTPGSVVPVWVTVTVPKEAAAGSYAGRVSIQAEGAAPVEVPLEVNVLDWSLSDPAQYRTYVEVVEVPDTLAVQYDVPLWSEKHFALIGQAMRLLAEVGNRTLYVPLIAQTNLGNEQTMVRWIRRGGLKYDYDFSVMDAYLDLAERNLGKPQAVVFNVWDLYLTREGAGGRDFQVEKGLDRSKPGPLVTAVDPVSKKVETVCLPDFLEPGSRDQWAPLFAQLRERLRKRGLEKAMMLGMTMDLWPTKEQVRFLHEVSGGLPWVSMAHYSRDMLQDVAPYALRGAYFSWKSSLGKSLQGWKTEAADLIFDRVRIGHMPITRLRHHSEYAVIGSMRGVARLGGDAWPVTFTDSRGREQRMEVWQRYPGGNWGYLSISCSLLGPGPAGPVATARFEAFRQGLQETEAVIVLDRALSTPELKSRLGDDLARRCENALNDRWQCLWRSLSPMQAGTTPSLDVYGWRERSAVAGDAWFVGSGWQERTEKLFSLAGEVTRKIGAAR